MYKITFDLPNLAPGAEVEVNGLGRFENGKTYVIDDALAETFRTFHQVLETEYDEVPTNDGGITNVPRYVPKPGPTVLQAFENTEGVTVQTYTPKKAEGDPKGDEPKKGDDK